MSITFVCPSCRGTITVPRKAAGTRGACPACRALVEAPRVGSSTSIAISSFGEPDELAAARADPGKRFGRYVLLGELGRGGMGVVHRAWDETLRRQVALKTLQASGPDADTFARRFAREGEALAKLRHPNIAAVHDAGAAEGRLYLAMELIEGRTLKQHRPGLLEGLEVVRDVARAIQHAHEKGVFHRDLKPDNILIGANGHPYVVDFGLAKLDDRSVVTRGGETIGTPAYMSPEQADGAHGDERTDVYQLGGLLYYVLCGEPPFKGASSMGVIAQVLTKPPVSPGKLDPRARGDLSAICLHCLEKDPRKRYGSAGALADEIERYLRGEAVVARLPGRSRRFVLGLGLAVLALAGGAIAWRSLRGEGEPARPRDPVEGRPRPAPHDPSNHAAPQGPSPGDTARALAARADDHVKKGELDAALADARRAVELDARDATAWSARAWARFWLQDVEGAVADATRAIELDPKNALAWVCRGLARTSLGANEAAIDDLSRAIDLEPGSAAYWSHRAHARYGAGDLDGALADATRSIELAPGDADSWSNRGVIRLVKKDRAGAISDLSRAIELAPDAADRWLERARIRHDIRDIAGSVADVKHFLEIAPRSPRVAEARDLLQDLETKHKGGASQH